MKLKHYTVALIPTCLAVFVFRAMELIFSIDPRTGHFSAGTVLPFIFNIFLLLIALFFCTVLFTKKEPKPTVVRLYRASASDTVFGIAGSVLLITGNLYRFCGEIVSQTLSLDLSLLSSAIFWQTVLSVFSAAFLIFFVTYPKRSAKRNFWRVMSLAVTAYYLLLLINHFRDLDVVFSHSFGIYLITFCGIAAMASINFSKILARLPGRRSFVFFTCLMAVLISLRLADAVLYLIPGNPYAVTMDLFLFGADVCITVLFLFQMQKLIKRAKRKPSQQTELLPDETEQKSADPQWEQSSLT